MKTDNTNAVTRLEDLNSSDNIRLLVDSFYHQVRQDELLGPVFVQSIKDWETHLPTMYQFWEKLLLGKEDYSGNPLQKHLALQLGAEHFATWVQLFVKTIDEKFSGEKADRAKIFARNIARTFQLRMGIQPESPDLFRGNFSGN